MDNLTHSLTGLMMSRAGLSRFHARAPLALILSANACDIDGLSLFSSGLAYIRYHRGLTHSIAFVPVMALLPLLVVAAIARSFQGWLRLYLLCVAGVASHLLLDWTNTYGVRFFEPFSSAWIHLDINSLIEGWVWAVLIFAWLMVYIVRLVSREIGAKSASGRGLAIFALSFFLVYDFGKYLAQQRVIAILNSRIYDGATPVRVSAFPGGGNPLAWRGWVETDAFFKAYRVNIASDFDPASGTTYYKPSDTAAIEAAKSAEVFRAFMAFNQFPRWSVLPVPEPEGARQVQLIDLRLGFYTTAVVDRNNRVLESSFRF